MIFSASMVTRPEIRDFGLVLVTQFRLDVCDFWDVPPPDAVEN